ncbi:hypothetical protein RclHR1_02630001 [Rhizophagus clarus]|uniref:F-box domain-containing protein n=1 Tax=Rhizophagus clarus TaxID=94130 RepID=A0A2Z6RUZ8_9GLOM|nr:hypothetical protein RclHR1_02630001 [Rhizophagus clarus]GET03541.1 hypothetical protein GLOIN_2v1874979 [Rhizophagus clarus]
MLKLNEDIFYLILQELKNDRKSLYSCLLVNKLLCQLVITILWKDPYKYLYAKDTQERSRRGKSFNQIILFHLPESSRNFLISEGINIILEQQKLLFDYIKYCQYICYVHESYGLTTHQKRILNQEVIKVFISKCYAIKHLSSTIISEHPIYTFPGANVCLSKLEEIQCLSCSESSSFYGLAQICRSIEKVSLLLFENNPGIAYLIEMQERIKYLNIYVDDNDYGFMNKNESESKKENEENMHERISQALMKHADSILYIMSWIDKSFPFFIFPKFINLQTLKLINSFNIEQSVFEKQLGTASYPNLQVLELSDISLFMATKIIENTNGNLWKVKIQNYDFSNSIEYIQDFNTSSKEYIRAITNHCPNIEYVSLFISNQNLDELKKLLISCQLLEGIDIQTKKTEKRFASKIFIGILVRLAPIGLRKIKIDLKIFTSTTLNLFFNNWRGRKTLLLYPSITLRTVPDTLKKYETEGIVKYCVDNRFWYNDKYKEIEWKIK